jgi:hypothetical protein
VSDATNHAEVRDVALLRVGRGLGTFDERWMVSVLKEFGGDAAVIVIEWQQAFPKQGVASTFKIGYGYGLWVGMCAALGYRYHIVSPHVWQRAMLSGTGKGKERSVLAAQRLFPTVDIPRHKHGRADALLIAAWALRYMV